MPEIPDIIKNSGIARKNSENNVSDKLSFRLDRIAEEIQVTSRTGGRCILYTVGDSDADVVSKILTEGGYEVKLHSTNMTETTLAISW